jgi:uncharacterized protein (DUF58 family)
MSSVVPSSSAAVNSGRSLRERISDWIAGNRGPDAVPHKLANRRIYIVPSKAGFGFLLTLVLLLLAAINYNLSLGFALTFFVGAIGWVALHLTHRNLLRLIIAPKACEPVFAGETARINLALSTESLRRYSLSLRPGKQFANLSVTHVDVFSEQATHCAIEIRTSQRGVFKPGRLEIFTRYPVSLFHAWSYFDFGQTVLVYPHPMEEPGPLPPSDGDSEKEGTVARGSDELAGLRDYAPGDSPRRIAWKVFARDQGLYTKEFHGYQSGDLWLDFQRAKGLSTEERLSSLCAWVLKADEQQLKYGLRLPGASIAPDLGEMHRLRCLAVLALYQQ